MKSLKFLVALCMLWTTFIPMMAQSVSINETGNPPDASSILDVSSLSKGLLVPRMTMAQRDAILLPATGLTVYQLDGTPGFYFYNGASWVPIASGGGGGQWTTNGTHIYNTNTGNVGIGLIAPAAKLHVKADNEAVRLQGVNPYISFFNSAGVYKGFIWQGPADNLSIGTGIGNTGGRVEVYNDGNLNLAVNRIGSTDVYGLNPAVNLRYATNSAVYGEMYKNGDDLEIAAFRPNVPGETPGDMILQTSISGILDYYAGRIGIGTRDPQCKVHVKDNLELMRFEGNGNTYFTFFYGSDYKGYLWNDNNNIVLGTAPPNASGKLLLGVGNLMALTIIPSGNVGIGTSNPTHKLAVNGTIRAKEVIVETGWSDYVFEADYHLKSLTEVEHFIASHGHLPGIPSAEEVETHGLKVGDTQRLMMEKIEELTLYVIALEKEVEQLKKKH